MPDNVKTFSDIMQRETIDNLPFAFLHNRIIYSDSKTPIDFVPIYSNKAFADMTGITTDLLTGRRISEMLQDYNFKISDLFSCISEIFPNNGSVEYDYYSEYFDKWFSLIFFNFSEEYFSMFIKDISEPRLQYENIRKILDFSPDLIVATDLHGNLKECNNKVLKTFGIPSRGDILNKSALNLLSQKDRQRAAADMAKIITLGSSNSAVYQFTTAEGTEFLAEMSVSLVYDRKNRPSGCVGIAKDITERILAEKALKSSEERFYKAFNSSPSCIAISTLKEGIYIEINNTFLETFGYERDEMVGKSAISLGIWPDKSSREKVLNDVVKCGFVSHIELKFGLKSGELRSFLTSVEPIILDGTECLIFSLNDISERIKAEEELKASEEKLRAIFSSSPDAMAMLDTIGVIYECNNEMMKMFSISSRKDVIGRNVFEFIDASDHDKIRYLRNLVVNEKTIRNMEFNLTLPPGKLVAVEISLNFIDRPIGHTKNIVVVLKDITDRKKIESEIKYLSYHDKLTGLYNRAFFEAEIERLDTQRQLPVSLIIGDLNGLKLTNDIFGHTEGDKLLQKVAKIVKDSCRNEDIVARWGGDEFAVILPKTENRKVIEICDRILETCEKAENDKIPPSIALGYATKESQDMDIQQLLKEAENWMYRHKLLDNRSSRNSIIASLEKTLFERNYETEEHAQRIRKISVHLGKALGLSSKELDQLNLLSILHDIGKIAVPDTILTKPGKLTPLEWEEMKKHTEVGYRIARSSYELEHIAEYILSHHERWDGDGYPRGLKGKDIPRLSRILSVVDAYDVMTHSRPYKEAMSQRDALDEIRRCSGSQFDPEISLIFLEAIELMEKD